MSQRRMHSALFAWVCASVLVACDGSAPPHTANDLTESPQAGALKPDHATVVRVDPGSGDIRAVFPTGPAPFLLVVAAGHVWTQNFGDGTLTHVDPSTGTASTVDVGEVVGIASDGKYVWVARDGNVVARLEGVTGKEVAAFRLAERGLFGIRDAGFVGVGGGSVWLTVPPRVRPSGGAVAARSGRRRRRR